MDRRQALVLAATAALVALAFAGPWPNWDDDSSGSPGGPRPAAAMGGHMEVVAPSAPAGRVLSFPLAHVGRGQVVAAWLRRPGDRRRLSARMVSRAARRGSLRIGRPSGWSRSRVRLVVWTASGSGVYGCGFGTFRAGRWPGGCWRPYSSGSPFNRALGSGPGLADDSAAVVRRVLGFGRARDLVAGQADTADDYERPVYWSGPGDPLFRLHCYEEGWGVCPIEGDLVRVPDAARPAGGADAHLSVVDQDSGWEYDLYKVRSKPAGGGLLEFRWGGRTRIDGNGLGSAATAAKFGSLAGIVRAAELSAGHIDHALFMTALCDSGRYVYPARGVGTSCRSLGLSGEGAPPMGARLQLDMSSAEIDALPVAAWKKTILHAMARYGMFVGDTGGGSWGIRIESGTSFTSFGYPDPMVGFAQANAWIPYQDVWIGHLHDGIDWKDHLRVIHPCVTQRTC